MRHVSPTVVRAAALAVLAAAIVLPSAASATELLTNGSFEDTGSATLQSWGGFTFGPGFSLPLPGWTVNSGNVDVTTTGTVWGPAADGQNSLDINGWEAGTISQTFATVLGRTYTVSFDYSRNAAGAPDPATATVSAGGVTLDVSAANDGSFGDAFNMVWKPDSFTFVGTGNPTTLSLAATVEGNGGVFFDKVSVDAVPEPATWALMIGGFGLAGAALRRRRTLAA